MNDFYSKSRKTIGIAAYSIVFSIYSIVQGTMLLTKLRSISKFTDYDNFDTVYGEYGYTVVMVAIVLIITSVFVFVGVATGQRGFVLPWLIANCLIILLGMPWLIRVIATGEVYIWMPVSTFIGLAIMIYFYIVVVSYYRACNCHSYLNYRRRAAMLTISY